MEEFTCNHGHTANPYVAKNGSKVCRVCRSKHVSAWRARNKTKARDYDKKFFQSHPGYRNKYNARINFGSEDIRNAVLERDGHACVKCGLTNEEHETRWSRQITIDHIDGQGSTSKVKNNSLDNLQTLCLTCHGAKDVRRRTNRPVRRV